MMRSPAVSTDFMVLITSSSIRKNSLPGSQNLTDKSVAPRDDGLDGVHDAVLVEAVHRLQVALVADDLVELRAQADALQLGVSGLELREHLGDRAAQAALDAVLLEGEDQLGLGCRSGDRLGVERLDRVHAEQAHGQDRK